MTDNNNTAAINGSRAALSVFNTKLHDVMQGFVDRQHGIMSQVLQRIDILEKGQKLDRTGRDMDTDDFEKLVGKVQNMDEKLTARVNDIDERMKVGITEGRLGTQILEVIQDNGSVNDAIQEMGREAARDVIDSFDFEYHHVERAVHDCIENMDLSEHFDEENIDVRRMDLDTLADFLVDERSLRIPLRQIDDHEDRLDDLANKMCTVITKLELIGIQLAPENNRDLYGDKRDEAQKFGDILAHIAKSLTPDDRQTIIELADGLVTRNKEASSNEEE